MTQLQAAFERLEQFISQYRQVANVPGVAVALTNRSELHYLATDGYADLATQTPVTSNTRFEIGSIGKSFTCIALLQQHEAGKLDLHAPVREYLPWFAVQSSYEPITVHHLMSHTAGLAMGTDLSPGSRYEAFALQQMEVTTPPGQKFYYSNVGYKTLGFLLEDLTRHSYGYLIQSGILNPLGMNATYVPITYEARQKLAVGYRPFYDDRPAPPGNPLVPATWHEYGGGDGVIASTPVDMAIYLRMLLNHGQGQRERILSEESFNLMTQPIIGDAFLADYFYGYGLSIHEVEGHTYVGHGGVTLGYHSVMLVDLDEGLAAVVLMNGPGATYPVAEFALQLLRATLQEQNLPPVLTLPDLTQINNAAEYAEVYKSGDRQLKLVSQDQKLLLHYGGEAIPLKGRGKDTFYVDHPDFALFLLTFGRDNERVVEVFHGADWYVNQHYTGALSFDYPQEWKAYSGHYRSHNPWFSNFRIVLRKGKLLLIYPMGSETVLTPLSDYTFCLGEDNCSPERLHFDTVVGGKALRVSLSGCDYYRTVMS